MFQNEAPEAMDQIPEDQDGFALRDKWLVTMGVSVLLGGVAHGPGVFKTQKD